MLINELKSEHLEIVAILKEVKGLSVLTKKDQAKLMSVKATLFEYLKKEDEKFYPLFYKVAEQNKKLKEILELFAKDLETVSSDVPKFFDKYKYSKEVLDTMFIKEFEFLFNTLCKRMRYEEFIFFDEYEELNKLYFSDSYMST